jgi:hypothetical protein
MNKMSSNLKTNIIYVIMACILLFTFVQINGCRSEKDKENKSFVIENLITAQEKIGLSQLLNISGYHLTNNGMYVNKFEDKVYNFIYKTRKNKPTNPKYFFCDNNEFIKLTDLFERNINNNQTIKDLGFNIIRQNRENCFKK